MASTNPVNKEIQADIIKQLRTKKKLTSFELLDIYFDHMPSMKQRQTAALERISQIVFELDTQQKVRAVFNASGNVKRVESKSTRSQEKKLS